MLKFVENTNKKANETYIHCILCMCSLLLFFLMLTQSFVIIC